MPPINHTDNLPDVPTTPGNICVATLYWSDRYYRISSCQHYYANNSGTIPEQADLDVAADTLFTTFGGEVDDIMDHEAKFAQVILRYLNLEGMDMTAYSVSPAIAGSMGTILVDDPSDEIDGMPPETALVIRKLTGKAGRKNRGRLFIPCISEQIVHEGIVDSLNYIGVRQAIAALFEPIAVGAATYAPSHWNRVDNILVPITLMGANQFVRTRKDRAWKQRPLMIFP